MNAGFQAPFEDALTCTSCSEKFGLLKHKHRCASCGFVFCAACLNNLPRAAARESGISTLTHSLQSHICNLCAEREAAAAPIGGTTSKSQISAQPAAAAEACGPSRVSSLAAGAGTAAGSLLAGGKTALAGVTGLFKKKCADEAGTPTAVKPPAAAVFAVSLSKSTGPTVVSGTAAPSPFVATSEPFAPSPDVAITAQPTVAPILGSSFISQAMWFVTRSSPTREAVSAATAAAASPGKTSLEPEPVDDISSDYLYADASPAELKTAKKYKFIGGFSFDWTVEQVLLPPGGPKVNNAAGKTAVGTLV